MIFEIKKCLYWRGIDSNNKFLNGYIFTSDKELAEKYLTKQGLQIQQFNTRYKIIKTQKLKLKTQITFYRQLSALLKAGLSLTQALASLAKTHENFFQRVLFTLRMHVEVGNSFYSSLQQFPEYFDNFTCQLIYIAENTGNLDNVLEHIANHFEKQKNLSETLQQALLYPSIVFVIAILITLGMLIFVIPQFKKIYAEFNAPLPTLTLWVIYLSTQMQKNIWVLLLPIIFLPILKFYYQRSLVLQLKFQKQCYSLPILNNLLPIHFSAKFAHALAMMISSGIAISDGLTLLQKIYKLQLAKDTIKNLQTKVAQGYSLHIAMGNSYLFTPLMLQMVKVGEESGMLDRMLQHVAKLHDGELNHFAKQITQLLEPLIIIILGVLIGSLVISMYLPIFKLGTVV